ncbi:MAG: methylated-DNA--[protein]-cysteine S-methyltransferase [Dehalococcoidia bacterium]|nr:methylated-DNA--[protein]-cysteine S-methyltransferase [Dehalococcoidia bacterium]MDH4300209.1 methylated-DNA--[protein]-cysteine S-methyltransferase [Dehalococcoidia bacterium]MDH4366752.1 methylated-DNA--[protein]-cysteine S-methyltransferase [Dehalococcoidia bacterium]
MNQINTRYHIAQIGKVILGSFDGKLCLLDFAEGKIGGTVEHRISQVLNAELVERDDDVLRETRRQLDEYLEGQRKGFDIPVSMVGTDFQKDVWNAVIRIPYGATSTYGQIARQIGSPRAVRAVGGACGANPISIIVPCHRVIGSDGELVGYGGGLSLKKWLLKMEQGDSRPRGCMD